MDPLENLVDDLIAQAVRRFPNARDAVFHLQRLGAPALQTSLDALACFASIASRLVKATIKDRLVVLIRNKWRTCLAPWVDFLLQKVVKETKTSMEWDIADTALLIIPTFLYRCHVSGSTKLVDQFKSESPELSTRISQTWLKVLDDSHAALKIWTRLLHTFFDYSENAMMEKEFVDAMVGLHTSNSHDVVASFLRTIARAICSANDPKEKDRFFMSFGQITWFILSIHEHSPLYLSFLHRGGTRAFAKLLSIIMIVPRLHDSTGRELGRLGLFMSRGIVPTLYWLMPGPTWIIEALDAGLLRAIVRALKAYRRSPILSIFHHFNRPVFDALAGLLDHINTFLAYPYVLRRVLGSLGHLHVGDHDKEFLRNMETTFLRSWDSIESQVAAIGEIYRNFKEGEGGSLCEYDECPKKLTPSQEIKTKYVRCLGCSSVMYCSRECAKRCWRTSHRENCARLERDRKDGRPLSTNIDNGFFRAIIRTYVVKHCSDIEAQFFKFAHAQRHSPYSLHIAMIDWRRMDMTSSSLPRLSWKDVETDMGEVNIRMSGGKDLVSVGQMLDDVDEDDILLGFLFPVSTMAGEYACLLADSLDTFAQPIDTL